MNNMNNRNRYRGDSRRYAQRNYRPAPVPNRRSYSSKRRPSFSKIISSPPVVMLVGITVLIITIICASAGVFGRRPMSSALPGAAPGFASAALRKGDPTETVRLYRQHRLESILDGMTTEQKVGQLLLLRSHDISDADFCTEISDVHAGGVVLFANDIKGRSADQLTEYIRRLQQASDGRMLICVDEEGGTVVRVSSSRLLRSSSFRSPQKLYAAGGMELIASDGVEKARFLRSFGFNVNFAPVADVVTSKKAMMYRRAFGGDAEATSEYVRTAVIASESEGVGTCLKHFPGYGNTSGDTHNGIVTLSASLDELRNSDLKPFAAGIEAGSGAVMITHTIMSSIDPDHPASMSPAVISILRDEMGFEGVIVSDGLDMGAITDYSGGRDVCVASFLAGIDLMCTPADGRKAYNALLAAVSDGTISMEQLDAAVMRILNWKLDLGLYELQPAQQ